MIAFIILTPILMTMCFLYGYMCCERDMICKLKSAKTDGYESLTINRIRKKEKIDLW